VPKAATVPSVLLIGAAAAVSISAVAMDVLSGEHPTHTVVLGLVVAVAALLRQRLGGDGASALSAVSSAVAAQPVLHLSAAASQPDAHTHGHHDLLHILASDVPAALVQVVAPALILVAVAGGAHLLYLLITAVRVPTAWTPPRFPAVRGVLITIRAVRSGSILRWCGWLVCAARRGPPRLSEHVTA
jgi:hypothetical protein